MHRIFVVPHAPLLVDIPGRVHPVPEIAAAIGGLDISGDIVLVTPHGGQTGIYSSCVGDLSAFGLVAGRAEVRCFHDLARRLASESGAPLLDAPLDHGAVVPLMLMPAARRVVVWALKEWTGQHEGTPSEVLEEADRIGEALRSLLADVSVVISAHTSAAVTPRAPLTERPEGKELDREVGEALSDSPKRLGDVSSRTWTRAGSCGAGPFRVLSHLVHEPMEVVHHSAPFGVGYVVAATRE